MSLRSWLLGVGRWMFIPRFLERWGKSTLTELSHLAMMRGLSHIRCDLSGG